jgi:hypothetical protein
MAKESGNRVVFLRWWLFNSLVLIGCCFAWSFDLFSQLWEKDATKLSFLILALYVFMSFWCGLKTFALSRAISKHEVDHNMVKKVSDQEEVGWFVSDLMTAIGMIGTVIGFIAMLGNLHSIDTSDIKTIQSMFNTLGSGMAIALLTTLVGLVCSSLLKIQYFNLGKSIASNTVKEEE